MNDTELRQVLLVRALEAPEPALAKGALAAPWTAADAQWASAEARRRLGESADPAALLVARAQLALTRLGQHEPAVAAHPVHPGVPAAGAASGSPRRAPSDGLTGVAPRPAQALASARSPGRRALWLLPLGAGLLGLAGDALVSGQRIQLLGWPLLGLLGWNLLVYLGLALAALRACRPRPARAAPVDPGAWPGAWPVWHPWLALVQRLWPAAGLAGLAGGASWRVGSRGTGDPAGTSAAGASGAAPAWLQHALAQAAREAWPLLAPLQQRRALALMHGCAAALALGAVLSMYWRGLGLDYRAGWDSTFLQPAQVHALLGVLLAPALPWPGLALPDVDSLAGLRWAGAPTGLAAGAPAAAWIHRLAITLGAVVVLPRLLLAAAAWFGAQRRAGRLTLPLAGRYFQQLLRSGPVRVLPVTVLPYSYHLAPASVAGLAPALADWLGPGAEPVIAAPLRLGAEDDLPAGLPPQLAPTVVLLMALTATPEREHHGAIAQRLAAQLPPGCPLLILLDSAGFMQRLAGQPDAPQRLQQRVQTWQRLLADLGLPPAQVIDLAAAQAGPA